MIMPSSLLVYPAGIIGREDINSGDKVILSVDILMACEQRQLTYPMVCGPMFYHSCEKIFAGVFFQ